MDDVYLVNLQMVPARIIEIRYAIRKIAVLTVRRYGDMGADNDLIRYSNCMKVMSCLDESAIDSSINFTLY